FILFILDRPRRRKAAAGQCRPSCTTSHNQCVTTQTIKMPNAVPAITATDPSKECRKGPGVGCDGARSEGASIHRPQSSSASRFTAALSGFLTLIQYGDRPRR